MVRMSPNRSQKRQFNIKFYINFLPHQKKKIKFFLYLYCIKELLLTFSGVVRRYWVPKTVSKSGSPLRHPLQRPPFETPSRTLLQRPPFSGPPLGPLLSGPPQDLPKDPFRTSSKPLRTSQNPLGLPKPRHYNPL